MNTKVLFSIVTNFTVLNWNEGDSEILIWEQILHVY